MTFVNVHEYKCDRNFMNGEVHSTLFKKEFKVQKYKRHQNHYTFMLTV